MAKTKKTASKATKTKKATTATPKAKKGVKTAKIKLGKWESKALTEARAEYKAKKAAKAAEKNTDKHDLSGLVDFKKQDGTTIKVPAFIHENWKAYEKQTGKKVSI